MRSGHFLLRMRGFTMVEMMVSLAIGLVVLAAMYASYQGASQTTQVGRALAQVTEDASAAMGILRTQVNSAAYSAPVGGDAKAGGGFIRNAATDNWVHGCDTDFADLSKDIDQLACAASGQSALAVAFEANEFNSITKTDAGVKVPLDCLGNALTLVGGYYLQYSRFYIANDALYCRGPGSASGQALVENVTGMVVTYGVAAAGSNVATVYQSASEVSAGAAWPRVVSVRVCLIVRSADQVLDAPKAYQGCDPFASSTTPPSGDRHLYRAFTSTFVIQNRRGTAL